jgi:hypothetical protein
MVQIDEPPRPVTVQGSIFLREQKSVASGEICIVTPEYSQNGLESEVMYNPDGSEGDAALS